MVDLTLAISKLNDHYIIMINHFLYFFHIFWQTKPCLETHRQARCQKNPRIRSGREHLPFRKRSAIPDPLSNIRSFWSCLGWNHPILFANLARWEAMQMNWSARADTGLKQGYLQNTSLVTHDTLTCIKPSIQYCGSIIFESTMSTRVVSWHLACQEGSSYIICCRQKA